MASTRTHAQRIAAAVEAHDIAALTAFFTATTADDTHALQDALQRFRDANERSLAHLAVQHNALDVLDFALAHDVDTSAEDRDGVTPVANAVLSQHLDALRLLLSYGASTHTRDGDHRTLLHVLAMHSTEHSDRVAHGLVNALVRSGDVDVDARDQCGNTALHLAAVYGSPLVAAALLAHGADPNARNETSASPLHFAAATGDDAIAAQLLSAGAAVDAIDALGNTPLIDAAFVSQSSSPLFAFGDSESQRRVVALLLEHGADADAVNCDGNTALFGAVRNGFEGVVALLSSHESDAFQRRNNRYETLLHVAARAQVTSVSIWETLLACCGLGSVAALDRFERTCVSIWMAWPQSFLAMESSSESESAASRRSSIRAVSELLLSIK